MRMPGRICSLCVNAYLAGCLVTQPVWLLVMTARGDPGRFIVQAREEGIGSR